MKYRKRKDFEDVNMFGTGKPNSAYAKFSWAIRFSTR